VREPEYPPQPEGKTETVNVTKKITIKVPVLTCKLFKCRMKQVEKTIAQTVPVEKFVGPSTDEIKQWEGRVAAIERDYQARFATELEKITTERSKLRREEIKDWVGIIGGALGGILGIANLALGIRKGRRERFA
jgi:hypothetical protein